MNRLIVFFVIFFSATFISLNSQTRIKMRKEGGVYTLPCEVNGLKLRFVLDTGASSVCISLTEAMFMLKNDYISKDDFVGSSKSQIADGTIINNTRIILREIKIGKLKLENVEAVVLHELQAPLLLGQSVIQRLGTIQLKGDELVIIKPRKPSNRTNTNTAKASSSPASRRKQSNQITTSKSTISSVNKEQEAKILIDKANKYIENEEYKRAINTYKEAYLMDRSAFGFAEYVYWGYTYSKIGDFSNALYYYSLAKREAIKLKDNYIHVHGVESWFGLERVITLVEMQSYISDQNYNQAILAGRKLLSDMNRNNVVTGTCEIYKLLSIGYYYTNNNDSAIKMAEAGIDSYIYDTFGKSKTFKNLRNVKDDYIGSCLYIIALNYKELRNSKNYKEYIRRAKEFGYTESDGPVSINIKRTLADSLDGNKKKSGENKRRTTTHPSRTSGSTKKYSVGKLTIDVINNENWDISLKTENISSFLTAKSKQNLSAISILYLRERLGEEVLLNVMKDMVGSDNIVLGRKRRSHFNVPGAIEVPYYYSDDDRMNGVINIFTIENSSYLIMTLEPSNLKSREFEDIYNSIRIR